MWCGGSSSGAEPLAERKGTRIRVLGDEQPVIAEADARRVERVLRNLVVNAVEHGEGRDVVVRLRGARAAAVAVAVRDYGVGLKPGEATRVFNRFWRAVEIGFLWPSACPKAPYRSLSAAASMVRARSLRQGGRRRPGRHEHDDRERCAELLQIRRS